MRCTLAAILLLSAVSVVLADDLADLTKGLKSKKTAERKAAAEKIAALGEKGRSASPAIIEAAIQFGDGRSDMLEALEAVNKPIHKHVVTILVDKDPDKVREALKDLQQAGEEAQLSYPVLLYIFANFQKLSYSDGNVPADALKAMAAVAPKNKEVVSLVVSIVGAKPTPKIGEQEFQTAMRKRAIAAASSMEIDPKVLVPALLVALADQQSRLVAVKAIAKIGPDAKAALPALKKLKVDESQEVREAAQEAIDAITKKD